MYPPVPSYDAGCRRSTIDRQPRRHRRRSSRCSRTAKILARPCARRHARHSMPDRPMIDEDRPMTEPLTYMVYVPLIQRPTASIGDRTSTIPCTTMSRHTTRCTRKMTKRKCNRAIRSVPAQRSCTARAIIPGRLAAAACTACTSGPAPAAADLQHRLPCHARC